jgi:SAM-dependent methyltransferase
MLRPQDILAGLAGGRVLDVATGSGGFVGFLLEGLDGYDEIIGIDTSERGAAAFAEAFKDKPHIRFRKMDAARMDFPDGSFDTVCISNSLHHLADLEAALVDIRRVLRPGGHFIVSEMYCDDQSETQMTHVLLHHWWGEVDRLQGIFHNETYTRQRIVSIVDGLGLKEAVWYDLADLDGDPHDPAIADELNPAIDRYIQRAEGRPDLQQRGEALRQRLQEVGFHGATNLLVIGERP